MRPSSKFTNLQKDFWANIRAISEEIGYTVRAGRKKADSKAGRIKAPNPSDIKTALNRRNLDSSRLIDHTGNLTDLGLLIVEYYQFRADVLNTNE